MPLLKAQYINHNSKVVDFGTDEGLFLNTHDLFDFDWNVQTRGNRIVSVNRKGIKEHKLPLVIVAETREKACELANSLFSICEADLVENKKGRLIVNGFNLDCFISGQSYSEWADPSKCLKISARVIRDSLWYKPLEPITFNNASGNIPIELIEQADLGLLSDAGSSEVDLWDGGEKGYYYGYPYNYPSTLEEYFYINNTGVSLSWKAIVFGSASSIYFYMGGHLYEVTDVALEAGERLEITAKESLDEKTVYKIDSAGNKTNCFSKRSATSYLFEPLPEVERIKISSASNLVWRLIPIIERSSPEWL